MFSGASGKESDYGVWRDSHMPPRALLEGGAGEPSSLLTPADIQECIKAAGPESLLYLGAKLGIRPRDAGIDERLSYNREIFGMIDSFVTT